MFSFRWKPGTAQQRTGNLRRPPLQRARLAIDRLARFSFFSSQDYRTLNSDIGAMDPAKHFVTYGADERRMAAKPVHIARVLGSIEQFQQKSEMVTCPVPARVTKNDTAAPLTIGIYVNGRSNAFMQEIAIALADLLSDAGYRVRAGSDNSDVEARPEHSIYVAPHEFFFLGNGPAWIRDDVLAQACMYCTEQVQTIWFWQSLHLVLMARSVIDMSMPLASAFSEVMPSACVFPSTSANTPPVAPEIMAHPLLRGQAWWAGMKGRPLDMCFLGTTSPYRARFFDKYAERLSRYENFIYLRTRNAKETMNGDGDEEGLVHVAQYVARHSRLMLNVHRDEFPYFEWHRLVHQGMANGCVAISEPCFINPDFVPGVHYLTEETHRLVELAEWALNDTDGREKAMTVAQAAQAALSDSENRKTRARTIVDILTA